jgi:hypothetical protein
MLKIISIRWSLLLVVPMLACTFARQTPQPAPTLDTLVFEVQTVTPTHTPVFALGDAPTATPDPNATATPTITTTITITAAITTTVVSDAPAPPPTDTPAPPAAATLAPTAVPTPTPVPPAPPAEPLQGGVWSFEDGFTEWANPFADSCPGSGLAVGWLGFTTRDQYGSACLNETVWKANVHSGISAQEITFAYVGIEAGVFRPVPTIAGHRYTVQAWMRREFSPATVAVSLGIDLTGGSNWQAETVQWFPWQEDVDDAWARTETTVTAAGQTMTIFIKGAHPYPEPGGALRLDSISIVDIGPE